MCKRFSIVSLCCEFSIKNSIDYTITFRSNTFYEYLIIRKELEKYKKYFHIIETKPKDYYKTIKEHIYLGSLGGPLKRFKLLFSENEDIKEKRKRYLFSIKTPRYPIYLKIGFKDLDWFSVVDSLIKISKTNNLKYVDQEYNLIGETHDDLRNYLVSDLGDENEWTF